ncbi:hypothetical protein [Paenibacillus sp. GCM10012306]|uniref:hypothetical protein n=1 Tax=Paenibacillus sp. GCM10012306 TaxID=3317342 RepID=UPI0036D244A1
MNILSFTSTHTLEYLNRMPSVLKWFGIKDINYKSSRYSRYMNYINDFMASGNKNFKSDAFLKANEAFQECIQIVDIFEAFKHETSDGFNERLEKVVKGQDFFDITSKNDSSRDFLYELTVAVNLKNRGYKIDFNQNTDVIATKGNDTFLIECKRLRSLNGLEENYKKAGKQLNEVTNTDNKYGLIFIDIYNCISKKITLNGYKTEFEMNDAINALTNEFYKANIHKIEILNDRFRYNSLGVCFTAFKNLWLSNETPYYFKKINVKASQYILDENYSKLEEVMSILKN